MMSDFVSNLTIDTVWPDAETKHLRGQQNTGPAFADALAHYATPLFPLWTPTAPIRIEPPRPADNTLSTHASDQRRERRQRRG